MFPPRRAFLLLVSLLAALACGCGARAGLDDPDAIIPPDMDSGLPDNIAPPPNSCGNGTCDGQDTCTNCPGDCGFCQTCGDGTCQADENCNACPQDCGACPKCGDGFCSGAENCSTCAPDCGKCASCGDGTCNGTTEDCFTCPDDCGKCQGCGDGTCSNGENCSSCPHDCGVCAVCGNNKCEKYETCANCPDDCGQCTTNSCFQAFTCSIKCIDTKTKPPNVSLSCLANCVALGCPNTQFFLDQAVNCAIGAAFGQCGGDFNCISKACGTEIAACLGSTCP